MSEQQVLLVEKRGDVDWVTLNRPDKLNAFNEELVEALVGYFRSLASDHSVRVVVLKANGKVFCAGLDFSPGAFTANDRNANTVLNVQKKIAEIYRAMRRCPQPIIVLIQGAACGGGFSLALAADIRIAGESARMNAAYITIGLTGCDMGSSYFLPRLVGTSVASELLLTGRFIEAPRALAVNLVSQVVPDDELEQAAQAFVDDMLRTSPLGLRLTKDGINLGVDANSLDAAMAVEDRQQTLLSLTEDATEAAAAFFSKRAPEFKNR